MNQNNTFFSLKNNVFRLLNILQVSTNRRIISACSDKKFQNSNLRVVSWNFIIEVCRSVLFMDFVEHSTSYDN